MLTGTPKILNTKMVGNNLRFLMVHFLTPNGQQSTCYDSWKMAGLLQIRYWTDHGYHIDWTRREGKGGGASLSQPTWPEDPGQEAYY
jgi:hypothetical protein